MKTFSIDGDLEKILQDLTSKFGYKDTQQTLHKGFLFLHLISLMDDEDGKLLYQTKDGELMTLDLFTKSEVQDKDS